MGTEQFMERLWAYKRINYLMEGNTNCTKGIDNTLGDKEITEETTTNPEAIDYSQYYDDGNAATVTPKVEYEDDADDKCEEEALRLALKYNFVTDLTSLVIEENDEYINKGPIQIGKKPASTYPGLRASGGLAYASYAYSAPAPSPNLQLFKSSSVLKSAGRPGPPPRNSLRRKQ